MRTGRFRKLSQHPKFKEFSLSAKVQEHYYNHPRHLNSSRPVVTKIPYIAAFPPWSGMLIGAVEMYSPFTVLYAKVSE